MKTHHLLFWVLAIAIVFANGIVHMKTHASQAGEIFYVDADASGNNDGTSWNDAFKELSSALAVANSNDEVWVAEGIYKPTNNPNLRNASFDLVEGVAIHGGFEGGESTIDERGECDLEFNPTVLSGNIGNSGDSDNSFHVVESNNHGASTILECFIIEDGNADGGGTRAGGGGVIITGGSPFLISLEIRNNRAISGGGIHIKNGSPVISNTQLVDNSAWNGGGIYIEQNSTVIIKNTKILSNSVNTNGGGIYNIESSPIMANIIFSGNSAENNGGGLYNNVATEGIQIGNCLFSGNSAFNGGGIYNFSSHPVIGTCTFSVNQADNRGGGIFNQESYPKISNSILWGNLDISGSNGQAAQIYDDPASLSEVKFSDVESGWNGPGNISEDPLFLNPEAGNFHLEPQSPAVNVGNQTLLLDDLTDLDNDDNTSEYLPLDLDNHERVLGSTVDMGAYENDDDAPTVLINAPEDGTFFLEGVQISFDGTASDPEDGILTNYIKWSSSIDGPLGTGGSIVRSDLSLGLHNITAGVTDTTGLTDTFKIDIVVTPNLPPSVNIKSPESPSAFFTGEPILFMGEANDPEDEDLTDNLEWTSSTDGPIGTGGSFTRSDLSAGAHHITATVSDTGNQMGSAQLDVIIIPRIYLPPIQYFSEPPVCTDLLPQSEDQESEDNDTPSKANGLLISGKAYSGKPNDKNDFYCIQVNTPGQILIDLTNYNVPSGDGQLQFIYDAPLSDDTCIEYPGRIYCVVAFDLAADENGDYHLEFIIQPNKTGLYYIRVLTPTGEFNNTPYTLVVFYPQ